MTLVKALLILILPVLFLSVASSEEKVSPKTEEAEETAQEMVLKSVTAKEVQKLLSQEEAPIVIDLRTPDEFKAGHIEGAKLINFKGKDFKEELAKLDPKKSYLFHCLSGGRSTRSLPVWKELGFLKLYHLESGFQGWENAAGKVVKEK